ncbi:MAG: hypothetical protein ACFFC7_09100 [Candidatus Hermodarchaeota archaeon]
MEIRIFTGVLVAFLIPLLFFIISPSFQYFLKFYSPLPYEISILLYMISMWASFLSIPLAGFPSGFIIRKKGEGTIVAFNGTVLFCIFGGGLLFFDLIFSDIVPPYGSYYLFILIIALIIFIPLFGSISAILGFVGGYIGEKRFETIARSQLVARK